MQFAREKSTSVSSRDNQVALNGMNNPEGKINSLLTSLEKEKRIINRMKVAEDENGNVIDGPSWTEVVRGGRRTLSTLPIPTALTNTSFGSKNGENRSKNWRQNLNLLTGTAVCNDRNTTLSSDVDLVAHGVAKNVTALQLSKFVQDRGVDLSDCTQLTKIEGARSLAFKVTIKPNDFEKCMNAEIWPYGLGLRRFKHFIPRQSSLSEDRPKSSNYIDGQVHRLCYNELRLQNHIGFRDDRFRNVRFGEDALIARNV